MPPKFDPNEVTYLYVRATGGEAPNVSALAPKLGPMGLSPKTIGDGITKNTKDWKGLRITVQLKVQNRKAEVSVKPSAAALVIKCLKEPSRDRKKVKDIKHDGDISLDDVYGAARVMRDRSMAATFAGTVKEILGTCVSVGCTVEDQDPRDIQQQIDDGEIECPAK
jgi:large subunit ribosomal protein L12e|eukprot:COSAG06_NODE_4483_length_4210_cov_6.595817_5_plen_166_part_00